MVSRPINMSIKVTTATWNKREQNGKWPWKEIRVWIWFLWHEVGPWLTGYEPGICCRDDAWRYNESHMIKYVTLGLHTLLFSKIRKGTWKGKWTEVKKRINPWNFDRVTQSLLSLLCSAPKRRLRKGPKDELKSPASCSVTNQKKYSFISTLCEET